MNKLVNMAIHFIYQLLHHDIIHICTNDQDAMHEL